MGWGSFFFTYVALSDLPRSSLDTERSPLYDAFCVRLLSLKERPWQDSTSS
jgi:hypothetical protein